MSLNADDFDRIITWIDLNTPEWGTWTERGKPAAPSGPTGTVPRMRRMSTGDGWP